MPEIERERGVEIVRRIAVAPRRTVRFVGVGGRRERAVPNLAHIGRDCIDGVLAEVGKALRELRLMAAREAEEIRGDEDLSVARVPCPDADGRNRDELGDALREIGRRARTT